MKPKPPTESIWSRGARTVSRACAESCLSRQMLWELMNDGTIRWFALGGNGTRFLCWGDVVDYLDGCHREHLQAVGAETN